MAISVGGNDARFYQTGNVLFGVPPGSLAGAPAAATASAAFAATGIDALVGAGARNISFLAGNTADLAEVASDPSAQAIRSSYSTTFNAAIQDVLAGHAANGVIVHYLDLETVGDLIRANPQAYGFTSTSPCAPVPQCVTDSNYANNFLFYVDGLHLTSAGFRVIGQYIATQLQAPLTLEAPSELGLDTARQFGRTLNSRVDLGSPRDGDVAEGLKVFLVGDSFSRDARPRTRPMSSTSTASASRRAWNMASARAPSALPAIIRARAPSSSAMSPATRPTASRSAASAASRSPAASPRAISATVGTIMTSSREGVVEGMRAKTDGDHWLAGAKAGYLFPVGIIRAGPVVAIDYAKAKVDGYTESGDPALTLNVGSVSAKSFTGGIGAELRGDFDTSGVYVRPYLSAMLEKELGDNDRVVRFSQTTAPGIVNSWSVGDGSDGAYGRLSAGGSAEIFSRVSLNTVLSTTVGRDDGNDVSASVGLNYGF